MGNDYKPELYKHVETEDLVHVKERITDHRHCPPMTIVRFTFPEVDKIPFTLNETDFAKYFVKVN
jgi:hypothetical protein